MSGPASPRLLAFAALGVLAFACKTSPETAPPGASAPLATTAPSPTPPAPATGAPAGAAGVRTYPDSTTSIQAAVGDRFELALPANITLPMKWRLEPAPDPKVVAPGEEKYLEQPPPGCPGCTGYGGTRLFSFTATGAGSTKLHFALRPLSDPNGAAQKEVSIDVLVK